jgi:hypothetical protein
MTSPWFRVAPLSDEDLLGAVQRSFRELIIPEFERLGADEFVLSQVRATLSMVGFVKRGLSERAVLDAEMAARAEATARAEGLDVESHGVASPMLRGLLRERLAAEISTRTRPA